MFNGSVYCFRLFFRGKGPSTNHYCDSVSTWCFILNAKGWYCVFPVSRENLEENSVEREVQSVKILLETGKFDKEMDAVEENSIEQSQ